MGYEYDNDDVTGEVAPGMGGDMEDYEGYSGNTEIQNTNQEMPEVTPVNFSKKKVWVILMFFFMIVLICLFCLSRCSIGKSSKSPSKTSDGNVTVESDGNSDSVNSLGSDSNNSQNSADILESDSSLPTDNNSGDLSSSGDNGIPESEGLYEVPIQTLEVTNTPSMEQPTEQIPEGNNSGTGVSNTPIPNDQLPPDAIVVGGEEDNGLTEVQVVPVMGAEVQSSGIVQGMHMYKLENSYIYGVDIMIVTGNNMSVTCQYFCPSKTYYALSVGDALSVTYQMDSQGTVSVVSISK